MRVAEIHRAFQASMQGDSASWRPGQEHSSSGSEGWEEEPFVQVGLVPLQVGFVLLLWLVGS